MLTFGLTRRLRDRSPPVAQFTLLFTVPSLLSRQFLPQTSTMTPTNGPINRVPGWSHGLRPSPQFPEAGRCLLLAQPYRVNRVRSSVHSTDPISSPYISVGCWVREKESIAYFSSNDPLNQSNSYWSLSSVFLSLQSSAPTFNSPSASQITCSTPPTARNQLSWAGKGERRKKWPSWPAE